MSSSNELGDALTSIKKELTPISNFLTHSFERAMNSLIDLKPVYDSLSLKSYVLFSGVQELKNRVQGITQSSPKTEDDSESKSDSSTEDDESETDEVESDDEGVESSSDDDDKSHVSQVSRPHVQTIKCKYISSHQSSCDSDSSSDSDTSRKLKVKKSHKKEGCSS